MTSSKQRKVIFFDFDGTICDPSDLISFVLRRILNEFEYNFSHDAVKKQGGKKIPDRLLSLGVANHKIGVIVKKFFNAVVLDVSKDTIKLCCSVEPLRELKEKGYEFVIISNNERGFIKRALEVLEIEDLFLDYFGSESFQSKDEMIAKLMKKYTLDKDTTYFVGDRFSDVRLSKKVGIQSVAIHNTYSISTLKEILSEEPDFMIEDFSGLKEIVLG